MIVPTLSIVVLNYNRLKYSKQTIENLINRTTVPVEYILVDNGSDKNLRDYLISVKNITKSTVKFAFSKYNLGVSGGRNRGILISNPNSKAIVCIDDDILVPEKWDQQALDIITKVPEVGIVGVSVEGREFQTKEINGVLVKTKSGNINGGCMIIPRTTFNKLGFFQTNYLSYGRDDTDLDFRAKRIRLQNFYIPTDGIHLDKNENKKYLEIKRKTHQTGSKQDNIFEKNIRKYVVENNYNVPYTIPARKKTEFDLLKGNRDDAKNERRTIIITTTLDCEDFIQRTINSVKNQKTKEKFVHIVVDIGSSDNTKSMCKEFEAQNDYFRFIECSGFSLPSVYNYLIYDYIPCNFPYIEYIAFLDQCDLFYANTIDEIVSSFDKDVDEKIGALYSGFSIIDRRSVVLEKEFKKAVLIDNQTSKNGQDRLRELFLTDSPCRYVKAFRLEYVYGLCGFKQRYLYTSEYHMFGKMLTKYMVTKIPKVLYVFRRMSLGKNSYEKSMEVKKIKKEFYSIFKNK